MIAGSPRLSAMLRQCGQSEVFADIGCDHGKLAFCMVSKNKAQKALLCDISEGSLQKARQLFEAHGLMHRAEFICGDGFSGFTQLPDTAAVAGMGGREIISIVKNAGFNCPAYVLQPMKNSDVLRMFMAQNGYNIVYDRCVYQGHKYYDIIRAEYTGISYTLNSAELTFGRTNLEDMHKDFIKSLHYRIKAAENILTGGAGGVRKAQLQSFLELAHKVAGKTNKS